MFRSFRSQDRVEKVVKLKKASYRDPAKLAKVQQSFEVRPSGTNSSPAVERSPPVGSGGPRSQHGPDRDGNLTSPIVTFTVGKEGRLFAAHEDVLSASSFFTKACRGQYRSDALSKRIDLPDEEPEIFSCVLEYLYVCDPISIRSDTLLVLQWPPRRTISSAIVISL